MNITNSNASKLLINIEVSGDISNAPYVYNYPVNIILPGNSSKLVPFEVSLISLVQGTLNSAWEVKTIRFKYNRPSIKGMKNMYFTSNVYASGLGCQSLTKNSELQTRCNNIPGCIYCSQYDQQRVLRTSTSDGDTAEGAASGRGLFVSVVPVEETKLFPADYTGVCVDGTNTLVCPEYTGSASRVGKNLWVVLFAFLFGVFHAISGVN
jgi:hypothetical protein